LDSDSDGSFTADRDNDNLTDADEASFGTNPDHPDSDSDGFSDGYEINEGYDPLDSNDKPDFSLFRSQGVGAGLQDEDGDGLPDLYEGEIGSDAQLEDSDNDGVADGAEILEGTDLLDADERAGKDSDSDGLSDAKEKEFGSNPNAKDSDKDGLSDPLEFLTNQNALNPDTNGDGVLDGYQPGPKKFLYTNTQFHFE